MWRSVHAPSLYPTYMTSMKLHKMILCSINWEYSTLWAHQVLTWMGHSWGAMTMCNAYWGWCCSIPPFTSCLICHLRYAWLGCIRWGRSKGWRAFTITLWVYIHNLQVLGITNKSECMLNWQYKAQCLTPCLMSPQVLHQISQKGYRKP
jgi:hypothetical protein